MMRNVRDAALEGKRVLVRCDFNVPLDGKGNITDEFRITQALPTLKHLIGKGAKLVVVSHLGDPEGRVQESLRLTPLQKALTRHLEVSLTKAPDCVGKEVEQATMSLQKGEVLLLENVRFHPGEEKNDKEFAKQLALLGDVYVNNAFSVSHRSHASVASLPKFLPSFAGLLLQKEVQALEHFSINPKHPLIAIVGGRKVKDKLSFTDAISKVADTVLLGNLLANEAIATSVAFEDPDKIVFPVDGVPGSGKEFDIGPKTRDLFLQKLQGANSVFWTGPLGWTEKEEYAAGSLAVAEAIIESKAFSVAGGGNLSAFLGTHKLRDKFSFVSTGGGASLAFLAGDTLPGLKALGYYGD